jgi:hypothetical protein
MENAAFNRQSSIVNRQSQGIALVITLIMLSVTLVMAVAFLALAKRERGSVTTAAETTTARLAADSALSAAQAQIAAYIQNTPAAAGNFGLLVSTNFINLNGFIPGVANVDNVNYDFRADGQPFLADDRNQNIANLYLSPRAPVFVTTNAGYPLDFRFYLDLNENGRFETNGWVAEQDNTGQTNGNYVSETGDPEWIGVLARPDQPHSADNPFVARYAFFAQPIGNSLDLNYIHNQAVTKTLNPAQDGYFRNQGVGSWELNLAAFLADLNTNVWDNTSATYYYGQPQVNFNTGVAFNDALSLLACRYNYSYSTLTNASACLNNTIFYPFNIDGYSDGPLQITLNTNAALFPDKLNVSWSGADSTYHFFALPSDVFDTSKNLGNFPSHLYAAGTGNSTYDRYTFYRMLAQLGTDSSPDDGKLNLNYSNAVVTYYTNNGVVLPASVSVAAGAETNLVPWRPLDFFTVAADRMLRMYTTNWFRSSPSNYLWTYYGITNNYVYTDSSGNRITNDPSGRGLVGTFGTPNVFGLTSDGIPAFGITNIPVLVTGTNVYSPAVNRLLQLAANFYDASTNSFYPSVFRPVFECDYTTTNVFIVGYVNISSSSGPNTVSGANDFQLSTPHDISELPYLSIGNYRPIKDVNGNVNVYGVPWIIGAKKGFPNFNKLGMQNIVQITRKLQIKRNKIPSLHAADFDITNQLYAFSISNSIGVECWNSYAKTYPNPVQINVQDSLFMCITNDYPGAPPIYLPDLVHVVVTNYTVNPAVNPWVGYSYVVPIQSTAILLSNCDFYFGTAPPGVNIKGFYPDSYNYNWESNNPSFYLPQFGLLTTNRLQLSMLDSSNGVFHVIDYVQLAGPASSRNLNAAFQNNSTATPSYDNMWSTNIYKNSLPYGIVNQIGVSFGQAGDNNSYWQNVPLLPGAKSPQEERDGFKSFLQGGKTGFFSSNYVAQVPYSPTAVISDYTAWQANDPLVHYLASDLTYNGAEQGGGLETGIKKLLDTETLVHPSYNSVNDRYQPWGTPAPTAYQTSGYNFSNPYNLIYKDPLIWSSDNWDFPTNQYPTVGWIGRVHRGTPWQSVYLKKTDILNGNNTGINTWSAWTGDVNAFDAVNSVPVQDRMLFDLFTTRFNDNAVRGTLSVNQTGLAAWSALFSGMVALSNNVANPSLPGYTNLIISPAGVDYTNSALWNIVTNLNATRTSFVNADGVAGTFEHAGDILNVPALGEQSPFLNWSDPNQRQNGISDEVYEWLPQQMMGLVRCPTTPRYVVYCRGQTLKPAPDGLVTGSSFFKLCTNYQVAAESIVRAVVRVDKHATSNGTNYSAVVESYNVLPSN